MQINSYFNSYTKNQIISQLDNAKHSVRIAMAYFKEEDLIQKLIYLKKNGVDVQLILNKEEVGTYYSISIEQLDLFAEVQIPVFLAKITGKGYPIMHHKFCVIDGHTVISGSLNWTNNAVGYSKENITIVSQNPENAAIFLAEFVSIRDFVGTAHKNITFSKDFDSFNFQKPTIRYFYKENPNEIITKNAIIKLTWAIENAHKIELWINNQYSQSLSEEKSTEELIITKSSQYKIVVYDEFGHNETKEIWIEVKDKILPQIEYFESNQPTNVDISGNALTLQWKVSQANIVELNGEKVSKQSGKIINLQTGTQVYKLTATNEHGSQESFLQVQGIATPTAKLPSFSSSISAPNFSTMGSPFDFYRKAKNQFPAIPPIPLFGKSNSQEAENLAKTDNILKHFFHNTFFNSKNE